MTYKITERSEAEEVYEIRSPEGTLIGIIENAGKIISAGLSGWNATVQTGALPEGYDDEYTMNGPDLAEVKTAALRLATIGRDRQPRQLPSYRTIRRREGKQVEIYYDRRQGKWTAYVHQISAPAPTRKAAELFIRSLCTP